MKERVQHAVSVSVIIHDNAQSFVIPLKCQDT